MATPLRYQSQQLRTKLNLPGIHHIRKPTQDVIVVLNNLLWSELVAWIRTVCVPRQGNVVAEAKGVPGGGIHADLRLYAT